MTLHEEFGNEDAGSIVTGPVPEGGGGGLELLEPLGQEILPRKSITTLSRPIPAPP